MPPLSIATRCKGCGVEFPSKNAVFRHLRETNGICLSPSDQADFIQHVLHGQRERVILLYGYWIPLPPPSTPIQCDNNSKALSTEDTGDQRTVFRSGDDVAQFLLDTIEAMSAIDAAAVGRNSLAATTATTTTPPSSNATTATTSAKMINRSYGHSSRGSAIVAQDQGTSAITEVLTTKLPPLNNNNNNNNSSVVQNWISTVNDILRERIRQQHVQRQGRNNGDNDDDDDNDNLDKIDAQQQQFRLPEIRLLGRQTMSVHNFNAEMDVSHRRIEYLLPADFLFHGRNDNDRMDQLPSFSDGVRSRRKAMNTTSTMGTTDPPLHPDNSSSLDAKVNCGDRTFGDNDHNDDDENIESTESATLYCDSPSVQMLALLTSYKRIMQSLTTHIVDLDTTNAAAVLEKQSHDQKRQRNRQFRNNNNTNNNNRQTKRATKTTLDCPDNSPGTNSATLDSTTPTANISIHESEHDDKMALQPFEMDNGADNEAENKTNSKKKQHINSNNPKKKKKEMILQRKRYHNFTPTVMAHEFLACRRMNRFYHRATLRFNNDNDNNDLCSTTSIGTTTIQSSLQQQQQRPFLVLSLSGDMFLTGQVCRAVGLFVALARGVIDDEFVECVFNEKYPHLVPTPPAPTFGMYAADVFYVSVEGKAKAILTPRKTNRYDAGWNDDVTIQNVLDWQDEVRRKVARSWLRRLSIDDVEEGRLLAEQEWTTSVLNPWVEQAKKHLADYRCWKQQQVVNADNKDDSESMKRNNLATAVPTSGGKLPTISRHLFPIESIDPTVPPMFEKVLYYLRQADASGLWPSTTLKRQLVMISHVTPEEEDGHADDEDDNNNNDDAVPNPSAATTSASTKLFVSSLSIAHRKAKKRNGNDIRSSPYAFTEGQGGASGSFSLGAMPGDKCLQPKGNALFPELLQAAFELEVALCPHRPPSSTIAVNRNAQFRPHTDSGAGAGQSTSLIVGLGTYSGGELMVEGEKMDIRYKPVEFDGWKQRHWTMPFIGERYSLVWFTPKGCEGINFIYNNPSENK